MHWDFALILFFLGAAVPWLGRRRIRQLMRVPQTTKMDRLALYGSTILFQWFTAAMVLWRAGAHGIRAAALGLAIPRPELTVTAAVLLCALVLANQILSLRRLTARPAELEGVIPQLALKIFPQDDIERLAFLALVVTVASCEELIYRGFIQHLFLVWPADSLLLAILGSAAFFALAHLYQGRRGLISTFIVGILFSAIRAWTGSLLAPLVAHLLADLTVGLLAPSKLRPSARRSTTVSDKGIYITLCI